MKTASRCDVAVVGKRACRQPDPNARASHIMRYRSLPPAWQELHTWNFERDIADGVLSFLPEPHPPKVVSVETSNVIAGITADEFNTDANKVRRAQNTRPASRLTPHHRHPT